MESRETSGMVSRQFNFIEIQLECIHRRRTRLFKLNLGVTVRSKRSDGYDETVHRGPFRLSPSRPIWIDGSDLPLGLAL